MRTTVSLLLMLGVGGWGGCRNVSLKINRDEKGKLHSVYFSFLAATSPPSRNPTRHKKCEKGASSMAKIAFKVASKPTPMGMAILKTVSPRNFLAQANAFLIFVILTYVGWKRFQGLVFCAVSDRKRKRGDGGRYWSAILGASSASCQMKASVDAWTTPSEEKSSSVATRHIKSFPS
jgi:hypothetical protein